MSILFADLANVCWRNSIVIREWEPLIQNPFCTRETLYKHLVLIPCGFQERHFSKVMWSLPLCDILLLSTAKDVRTTHYLYSSIMKTPYHITDNPGRKYLIELTTLNPGWEKERSLWALADCISVSCPLHGKQLWSIMGPSSTMDRLTGCSWKWVEPQLLTEWSWFSSSVS